MSLQTSLARTIKEEIRDKIVALSSVEIVYTFEPTDLRGFPAVIVKYGDVDGEFWATNENQRIYGYKIIVLDQIGQTHAGINDDRLQEAEENVAKVVEDIMNALDSDYELGQFNAEVVFLDAVDVLYQPYSYPAGEALGAELTVRVHTFYDV